MSKLGPKGQALVDAARNAPRPSPADRARVLASLRARIAAEALSPSKPSTLASTAGWPVLAGLAVGLGLLGAIAWQLHTPRSRPPVPSTPAPSSYVSATPTPTPSAEAPLAPAPSIIAVPTSEPRAPAPRSSARGLAEEVTLLSRAETELHAGHFASALRLLDDYERKFPGGTLVQEDVAAKVRALCGLGRVGAAKAELKRLAPGSPHEASARAACGAKLLE
jgi:hypothetical protein